MDKRPGDVHLAPGVVTELLAAQFPEFAHDEVAYFGGGWDHWLFSVGDEWLARFPKRAQRVAWLVREMEVLVVAGETLGSRVPQYQRIGEPSELFPFPFVVYRRLLGVGADQSDADELSGLARDLGELFVTLHRIAPDRIPAPPSGGQRGPWAHLRHGLVAVAEVVRPHLSGAVRERAEPYLAGEIIEPKQNGPRRFIHNDICPDHVIVDPHTGRLVGLIDLTDAMVAEPVLDFVGLIGIGGYPFLDAVLEHYDLWRGDDFERQLEWLARTLTLIWLAEAVTEDPRDIPKYLTWVEHAFAR